MTTESKSTDPRPDIIQALDYVSSCSLGKALRDLTERNGKEGLNSEIARSVCHLCVEIMLSGSERACIQLVRILDCVLEGTLDELCANAALGCLCKSDLVVPTLISNICLMPGSDPYSAISQWGCVCGSACILARRICMGKSPFELAIESLNFTALEKILENRNPKRIEYMWFVKAFRKRKGADLTVETLKRYFPEKDYSESFALAEIVAHFTDAKEGRISVMPVERIGMLGRLARQSLPDLKGLDGLPILFTVAETAVSVSGRDIILQFLIDMKVKVPETLLESVVVSNPSFWISQNNTLDTSPVNFSGWHVSEKFLRISSHIIRSHIDSCCCCCKACFRWRSSNPDLLMQWLDTVTNMEYSNRIFPGYKLLELVKSGDELSAISLTKNADMSVTDARGNTVIHLASNVEILRKAFKNGIDVNAVNKDGWSPLDCAIIACDSPKITLLISFARATFSSFALERLCGLLDGNPSVLSAIQKAARDIHFDTPKPRLNSEIDKLKRRVALEKDKSMRVSAEADNLKAQINQHIRKAESLECEKHLLERQLKEMQNCLHEQETRECSVCMDIRWDTALPCGHCFCFPCANAVCKDFCPVCSQASNSNFIRLFNCR